MALFMDIELVSVDEEPPPDAYGVVFDVIYSGETWCRSLVRLTSGRRGAARSRESRMVAEARDALLELLETEVRPVSFDMRLTTEGTVVLARANPGRGAGRASQLRRDSLPPHDPPCMCAWISRRGTSYEPCQRAISSPKGLRVRCLASRAPVPDIQGSRPQCRYEVLAACFAR